MSQQDENLLPDWNNLPIQEGLIQERLKKQTERYEEEYQEQLFRRQVEERGLSEALRLRKQRERYKEKKQELARIQEELARKRLEEWRLEKERRRIEQYNNFRRFLSEYTEEGETYSISFKTLKDWYLAWVYDYELPDPDGLTLPLDEVLKDKFLRDEQGYPVWPKRFLGLRMKRPITLPTTYDKESQHRKHITKTTRMEILDQFNASGRICALCDKVVETHEKLHLDHILPISQDGTDDISNLQYVHARCNLRRNNLTVNDARARIRLKDLRSVTSSMSRSSNMDIWHGVNTSIGEVVSWHDKKEKWRAQICIYDRLIHLGYYRYEENANKACQEVLDDWRANFSIFEGIKWINRREKWQAQVWIDGRLEHLGYYEDEETAHEVYQKARANRGET